MNSFPLCDIRFRDPGKWQEFRHGFLVQTVIHQITVLVQNEESSGPITARAANAGFALFMNARELLLGRRGFHRWRGSLCG